MDMDTTIATEPRLSDYDWWELEAFWQKIRSEGFSYAAENYPPRFEHAGYERLPADRLREMLDRYQREFDARWAADGQSAADAHNAHIDESRRRADHRALWAVRFSNGNVATCETEESARCLHGDESWGHPALLTRDVPGGQWREVAV